MIKQAAIVLASFIAVGGAVMACNGNTGAGAADSKDPENACLLYTSPSPRDRG